MFGTIAFISFLIGAGAAGLAGHDLYQRREAFFLRSWTAESGKAFWYNVAEVLGGFCVTVTALRALIYA